MSHQTDEEKVKSILKSDRKAIMRDHHKWLLDSDIADLDQIEKQIASKNGPRHICFKSQKITTESLSVLVKPNGERCLAKNGKFHLCTKYKGEDLINKNWTEWEVDVEKTKEAIRPEAMAWLVAKRAEGKVYANAYAMWLEFVETYATNRQITCDLFVDEFKEWTKSIQAPAAAVPGTQFATAIPHLQPQPLVSAAVQPFATANPPSQPDPSTMAVLNKDSEITVAQSGQVEDLLAIIATLSKEAKVNQDLRASQAKQIASLKQSVSDLQASLEETREERKAMIKAVVLDILRKGGRVLLDSLESDQTSVFPMDSMTVDANAGKPNPLDLSISEHVELEMETSGKPKAVDVVGADLSEADHDNSETTNAGGPALVPSDDSIPKYFPTKQNQENRGVVLLG